jgi:adenylate cyclase
LKALELDDRLAEAHEALGAVLFWYEYDWPGAEKEFRRAIELNENLAMAHTIYGWYLTCLGHPEKGIAEGVKAKTLDPLAPEPLHVLSQNLYLARRYRKRWNKLRRRWISIRNIFRRISSWL